MGNTFEVRVGCYASSPFVEGKGGYQIEFPKETNLSGFYQVTSSGLKLTLVPNLNWGSKLSVTPYGNLKISRTLSVDHKLFAFQMFTAEVNELGVISIDLSNYTPCSDAYIEERKVASKKLAARRVRAKNRGLKKLAAATSVPKPAVPAKAIEIKASPAIAPIVSTSDTVKNVKEAWDWLKETIAEANRIVPNSVKLEGRVIIYVEQTLD